MDSAHFSILKPNDETEAALIADWYFTEWKIPREKTLARLQTITRSSTQFQAILKLDDTAIATAGLYSSVGLVEHQPKFVVYKNWLAVVYTLPEYRGNGYGTALCNFVKDQARGNGVTKMYLFTDTAESLYRKLGWTLIERVSMGSRNVAVMNLELGSSTT